ncbi:AAA family ATPase [Rhodococcus sp. JG-3]|uniref:AAA family ATPase n=1 Tax=Rhodococcus sp. JG-3 TaxID=1305835 RepID=UPI00040BFD0C|nr:AAA family ATPase [Rhodococcus sp. JG-3]
MSDEEYALPKLWKATDLTAAAQPKWLARGRIPRAAISLLVGDEGIGKSLFWVLIAAAVTTGRALAEFGIPRRDPENVIVVITEDDWAPVVLPRLIVAGADLDRISVICTEDDGSGAPIFPRDMHVVTDADVAPGLIVVDAWLDTVPSNLSVKDPQQARRALHPWKEAAVKTGAAVLLLTHTNRLASANARDKYGATGELRKKARMALFAQADPDDEGHLLIGPEKANSAGKVVASKFAIVAVSHFASTPDDDGTVPRLDLIGDSAQTMKEHISNSFDGQSGEQRGDYTGAAAWLEDYLTQQGRCPAKQAKTEGIKAGHNERTIERAAKKLKVVSEYQGFPRIAHWSLPSVVDLSPDEFTVRTDSTDTDTHHSERVGTVGTEPDQQKRDVGTGHELQLRHPHVDVGTGVGTASADHAEPPSPTAGGFTSGDMNDPPVTQTVSSLVPTGDDQAKQNVPTGVPTEENPSEDIGQNSVTTAPDDRGGPSEPTRWRVSGEVVETPPRLHVVADTDKRVTALQWVTDHVMELIDAGTTTVESSTVYGAGEAAGFRIDNLRQAVKKCELIGVAARKGSGTVWSLGTGGANTIVSAEAWLTEWLRSTGDSWVKAADVYAAGLQAGYGRDAVKAASRAPHIRKRGQSISTEWSVAS